MNLYEIILNDDIIYNSDLLDAFLFDCKCVLFLVDMTNHTSFNPVKDIISFIHSDNLKKIIVENKSDVSDAKPNEELQKYIKNNSNLNIDYIKISIKTQENLENLLVQIYDEVSPNNSEKKPVPVDSVDKCISSGFPNDPKNQIDLILIGDSSVGKSNFSSRYIKNAFNALFLSSINPVTFETKGLKIYRKNCYQLKLWDTAGQERFKTLPRSYYRNADGILLIFDINEKDTFNNVSAWISEVRDNIDIEEGKNDDIVIYLIGNKIDLFNEEKVKKEEIEELVHKLRL